MDNVGPWTGRRVVVCGGTSGLGLQLVIATSRQKANLLIVGRDILRLESAMKSALDHGASSAVGFSMDLGLRDLSCGDTKLGIDRVECDRIGGVSELQAWLTMNQVDLLINAVGRSDRGHLEQLSDTDLASMLNDNLICTWNMTRMALDSVKRARGTIVNIGSLAGLVAAPGMGGYSIAKSALTAMTRQLRLELARSGVHVMLVCPGPIARQDQHDQPSRYQQLAAERGLTDPSSTSPGGGVKLRLIDPTMLCNKILNSAHRRQKELVTPMKAAWLSAVASLAPSLADWILRKYIRS